MLKREQETFQYMLDHEEEVIKALEKHYRDALHDINMSIRIMQSDELTQSKVYQLEYQKALKKQVEGILERMHAKEYTTIQQYLSDSYKDAFVGTMYSMHGQGIPIIAAIDQNAAVKAVITDSKISEGLYEHLGIPVQYMKKAISAELARGISSNMRYSDIARNIENITNAPKANAKNIVRTEGHRIQQASSHDARLVSKSKGADVVKQWDATLDGATRTIHRDLDGKIVEVDEHFEAGGVKALYPGDFGDAGLDCNCRCVALTRARWALDEAELETLKERAAFFKLDKTDNFEDFKKKYLKAASNPEAITPEKPVKTPITKAPVPLKKQGKSGKIKVDKVITGHAGPPKQATPDSVIDHIDKTGKVDIRAFYGPDGFKKWDIHTTAHGNPKTHPYGEHGEHAHDYTWDENGKLKARTTRELTKDEREGNGDIL